MGNSKNRGRKKYRGHTKASPKSRELDVYHEVRRHAELQRLPEAVADLDLHGMTVKGAVLALKGHMGQMPRHETVSFLVNTGEGKLVLYTLVLRETAEHGFHATGRTCRAELVKDRPHWLRIVMEPAVDQLQTKSAREG